MNSALCAKLPAHTRVSAEQRAGRAGAEPNVAPACHSPASACRCSSSEASGRVLPQLPFQLTPPTWGQEPPAPQNLHGQHHPAELVLTELALLGLGQGLPAPGPLTEGETRDSENGAGNSKGVVPAGAEPEGRND